MPNDKQSTPGREAVLINQMLVYKHRRVIQRIVIPRIESIAKTLKLDPRINFGMSSDRGITNPRFILHF